MKAEAKSRTLFSLSAIARSRSEMTVQNEAWKEGTEIKLA
jgi:hypothetical protein